MTPPNEVVFLFDVDNTFLDNDRVQEDLKNHLEREFGAETQEPIIGQYLRRCAPGLDTRTTWALCNVTASRIYAIRDC